MISKIISLKNVGLFADAVPSQPLELDAATIIYAENGRGKSTLASIFHACSLGDRERIKAQKTIDSDKSPEIQLLIHNGTDNRSIQFSNPSWKDKQPNIVVFDSKFVDRNVYSGFEVGSGQKKSLLEFALGDDAVKLKDSLVEINKLIQEAVAKQKTEESKFKYYCGLYSVPEFIELKPDDQIEGQLRKLDQRIAATKRSTQILSLAIPNHLAFLDFDLQSMFRLLQKQIDDLANNAEEIVRTHLDKHESSQLENWLSQGQDFSQEDCPFCGQHIVGIELIQAYRLYFSQEYNNLKTDVEELIFALENKLGKAFASKIENETQANSKYMTAWQEHIPFPIPELNIVDFKHVLSDFYTELMDFASKKQQQPLEVIGTAGWYEQYKTLLDQINHHIERYNTQINKVSAKIVTYKKTLTSENSSVLETKRTRLKSKQSRQLPKVIAYIAAYKDAVDEHIVLKGKKATIRTNLSQLMTSTLDKYQERVNALVASFHAEFAIEKMKADYRSRGNPRSDYGLVIRGKSVGLGKREDMFVAHSFGNVLSEADKRTLAFAFFVARLEDDPNLGERVVVLDDPVSSLDINRRRETIRTIADLANKCNQLIVFSHDAYFVRDLRNKLEDPYPSRIEPIIHKIRRASNGYSVFDICDIDSVCASPYYHHYKLISDYVDGIQPPNNRDVAKAIRPLLEGYLHRRFPNRIKRGQMFGTVIANAQQAILPDILANLHPILEELRDINNYAKDFHHDTNPDADGVVVNATALHGFAKRALDIIHQNG